MFRLNFSVYGEDILSRELLAFSARGTDMAPAFAALALDLMGEIEKQFDTEGEHVGGKWAPLQPSTSAFKEQRGLDPRILHATLQLRNSLISEDAPGNVLAITPESMTFGTSVEYGKYHQSTKPRQVLPRRPFLDLSESFKVDAVRGLQHYLVTGELWQAAV